MLAYDGMVAVWREPVSRLVADSGAGHRAGEVLGFLGGTLLLIALLAVGVVVFAALAHYGQSFGCAGIIFGIVVLIIGWIIGNRVVEGVGAGISALSLFASILSGL